MVCQPLNHRSTNKKGIWNLKLVSGSHEERHGLHYAGLAGRSGPDQNPAKQNHERKVMRSVGLLYA